MQLAVLLRRKKQNKDAILDRFSSNLVKKFNSLDKIVDQKNPESTLWGCAEGGQKLGFRGPKE